LNKHFENGNVVCQKSDGKNELLKVVGAHCEDSTKPKPPQPTPEPETCDEIVAENKKNLKERAE